MTRREVESLVRHMLTGVGPLVAVSDPDTGAIWDQVVGALMFLGGTVWGIVEKRVRR